MLLLIEGLIEVASVYVVAEVELELEPELGVGVGVGVTTVSHHEGELL